MTKPAPLTPASELARHNKAHFPNESAPDLDPLWNRLDQTPAGRGTDWYPHLSYGDAP